MDTVPLPGIGTLALPGTLISTFCASFTLVGPGLLTLSVFLQAPGFQWSGNAIRVAELIAFRGARAARRNGCGTWRHRPVGFPAPEEAGWITG
jgi:hypothetical protein